MSIRILRAAVAATLALPAATALANGNGATDLDEILVTATRTPITLQDSIVPAQVIDRAEIKRSQATSLTALLRGRAGIDIGNQGGLGKISTVFMRGTESDHVLVLVDGIRIGSATAGLASFQDLPVEQIERIEIVRGPRSSLYGSEAIGGVIQIFTRRGGEGLQQSLRLGVGSHNLREASAGFSNSTDFGWLSVNAGYQETDGINACRGTTVGWGAGCYVDEPDKDGYRNLSLSLRGGVNLTDTLSVEGNFFNADARNEFDGSMFGGNEADNVQRVFGGKVRYTPSERFDLTVQAGRAQDKSRNFYADAGAGTRTYVSTFDTRRDSATAQGDVTLAEGHLLSIGADWQKELVESTTTYDMTERDNKAAFVEYQGRLGGNRLQASLRNDDNEQFGNHTTGSLGWGYDLAHGFRVNASYATGFKAPSFNDLYYPYFGNPDLSPEKSKSLNLGVSQSGDNWNWTFNVFENRVDDLISYDSALFLPNNIDRARIRGAELTFSATLAGWDLSAQVSHVDPRNRTEGVNHDNLLARRARTTGRIDVDKAFGAFRVGTTFHAASNRYDDVANSVRLAGYSTLDLRVEYAFHPDWTLQARASNVFDRDYETVAWYNQPGREYGLSLRYAPAAR